MRSVRRSITFDAETLDRLHRAFDGTGIPETTIVRRAVALYLTGAESQAAALDRVRIQLALREEAGG